MEVYYYSMLSLFAMVLALMVIDSNVSLLIEILSKNLVLSLRKLKWIILNNPDNPIVRWMIWRRSYELARKLKQEIENKK